MLERIDYRSIHAAAALSQSLQQTGFAILHDHPIPLDLIAQVYGEWRDFFASELKYQYLFEREQQTGYFPFQLERAKDSQAADLKEFYHLYQGHSLPLGMSNASGQLFDALIDLGSELLGWINQNLTDALKHLNLPEMIRDSDQHLLRILHYPPLVDRPTDSIRAAAHEDINLITLLPAATASGLEILDRQGHWQAIASNPQDLIINVGDMLQLATNFELKSTTHRVVNPNSPEDLAKSRYSLPMFLHCRKDVRLSADYTASSYLQERLQQIGLK
ncbi:MAG: 2OG-Fe(II) oxygenase family protein [Pseudanabaenaceae cyanobacterium bins.68]|nr:2OG-Fe(II) oxygenase family protein [Pseudanabaenaceae cyanobacterium bins.68]